MAVRFEGQNQNPESDNGAISARRMHIRRWHRNAVAVLLAGTLVVGVSFPAPQLIAAYAADSGASETMESLDDATNENGAVNANTNANSATNANASTSNTNSATNANSQETTNANANNASATEGSTATQTLTDPEAATPNLEFGEPTTDVVIEGSVNGEIMAKIALAEPDGKPEGGDYNKYNYGSGLAWCAYFVMYCARAAGLSTEVIPNYPLCSALVDYYKGINRWQTFTTKYTPHVGDLIFYSSTVGGEAEHVGIAVAATETTVTSREGNTNDAEVATHVFSTTNENGSVGNDWYIVGYASPNYPAENSHEHTNQVHVTQVSDTGHLVTYDDCVCGYHKDPEIVSHNFQSAYAGISLSDASEWQCNDCGFVEPHYTTGIMESASTLDLYDSVSGQLVKELPSGSVTVTSIELAADGNYWGTTAGGYKIKMSQAGIKQAEKFDEMEQQSEAQVERMNRTKNVVASEDVVETGAAETVITDTGSKDYRDATAVEVGQVKKGDIYLLEIDSVTSLCSNFNPNVLGTAFCKLIYADQDGNWDTSAFKYYGTNSYKLDFSQDSQWVVIAPDFDATLVLAAQYGSVEGANNVQFNGVTLRQLS